MTALALVGREINSGRLDEAASEGSLCMNESTEVKIELGTIVGQRDNSIFWTV